MITINNEGSISIEDLEEVYEVQLEFDTFRECYYLMDSITEEQLTPCMQNIDELEYWLGENWDDDFIEKLTEKDD